MQPTLEDLKNHCDAAMEKFGQNADIGYANVSQTQFSIARHSGNCKVNDKHYIYNPADDSLMREDIAKWLVEQMKKEAEYEKQ